MKTGEELGVRCEEKRDLNILILLLTSHTSLLTLFKV